jgi:hypothetical protein
MKVSFKEFLHMVEGGMVADDKAEEGKSKPKIRPSTAGAQNMQVKTSGVAGGTGGGEASGGMAGGAAPAAPMMGAKPPSSSAPNPQQGR